MGKTAQDIVNAFIDETGARPKGRDLSMCLNFAAVILQMDEDAKNATPSVRHYQDYAENRADEDHRISHQTFYNNEILKSMMNWALAGKKKGKDLTGKSKSNEVKVLTDQVRRLKKQVKSLVSQRQEVDPLINELKFAKINEIKSSILLNRILDFLRMRGLDGLIPLTVSDDEIMAQCPTHLFESVTDIESDNDLVQVLEQNVDEQ